MKKRHTRTRIGSVLVTLAMLLTLLPATAWADGEWEEVSTADAFTAALGTGGSIKLTGDITVTSPQTIQTEVVLDLNGHKITGQISQDAYLLTVNGGSLTVTDNLAPGADAKGCISVLDAQAIWIQGSNSRFTLENGTIEAKEDTLEVQDNAENAVCEIKGGRITAERGNKVIGAYGKGTVVNISGGEIEMKNGTNQCFYLSGSSADSGVTLNMTGGKMISSAAGIYVSNFATVNISEDAYIESSGTQYGALYIGAYNQSSLSKINISGGTIKADSTYSSAIYANSSRTYCDVAISGGNLSSESGNNLIKLSTSNVNLEISGGTFRDNSGNKVDVEQYISEGVKQDETGEVVEIHYVAAVGDEQFETLQDAIAAVNAMDPDPAEGSEATITLLDDVSITSTPEGGAYEFFALPANTTLNGAMHRITVNVPGVSGNSSLYHVIGTSGANVRIEDLTITGDYQSDSDDYCTRAGIHAYKGAEVKISNVTISGCGSVAVQVNGSAVTADNLNAFGNNWGSVNVDMGIGVTTIPSFTFNSGNLQDNAQIYTELTDKILDGTPGYEKVITLGPGSGLLPTPVEGVGYPINGKLYYTDDHAKLGEAYNESTKKVYTDLDTALSAAAQSGGVVTVVRDAELDANGTIGTGVTLVVAPDVTLTIPDGSTLTNNGTIVNNGTIDGTVQPGTGSVTVAVTFNVTPPTANATVTLSPAVEPVQGNDKMFLLESGKTYTYTVSASGYYNYTGSVTVSTNAQTVPVTLTQIPSTPSYDSGSSSPTYSNTIEAGDGGTVKVSPRTPEAGDTVTITPDPDAGYEVDEVIVTDRSGDEVRVTANRNGTYTFKQPRGRVTIEVTFVRTGGTGLPFLDVAENAWYADAVAYVYENGLMSGTASNLFSPDATTTRGMIVTMLYRLEGEPRVTTGSAFNDVDAAMYYADAIAWANANGIVTGYDEATFGPNDAITREQMAAILYRYAQYKGYGTATGGMAIREYADYESISEYALTAMGWAVSQGLVTGTSNTTLTPDGSAIRAQIATIFMRFMEDVAA